MRLRLSGRGSSTRDYSAFAGDADAALRHVRLLKGKFVMPALAVLRANCLAVISEVRVDCPCWLSRMSPAVAKSPLRFARAFSPVGRPSNYDKPAFSAAGRSD